MRTAIGFMALLIPIVLAQPAPGLPTDPVIDYDRDVKPILTGSCLQCHGAEKPKNGLRVDRRSSLLKGGDSGEPAVVPGKPVASFLLKLVRGDHEHLVMPPKGDRLKLQQIEVLERWIASGARMPDESALTQDDLPWSLRPVQRPAIPKIASDWIANPIDAFVLRALLDKGLETGKQADPRTLIRRAYLDVTGLLPSPEEVEAFVKDQATDGYPRVIDKLLANPQYGERWALHWLDVVRYGDTDGFEVNTPRPNAWPYRDWVIKSLNDDKPYDRFVMEQLAGDALGQDAATGFLVAGPAVLPGQVGKDLPSILQARQDELHEIVNATSTAFLGLTVGCARCHNHKFDPISQSDYYAMQAVFAGVRYGERPMADANEKERKAERDKVGAEIAALDQRLDELEPMAQVGEAVERKRDPAHPRRNVERFAPVDARFVRFTTKATNNGIEPCIDELEILTADPTPRNVALATAGAKATSSSNYPPSDIHKLEHVHDGRYGNGRSWISGEMGKGWVQLEFDQTQKVDKVIWARDREGKFADRVPVEYVIEVAVEPNQWRTVASSADRHPYNTKPDFVPKDDPRQLLRVRREALRKRLASLSLQPRIFAGAFQPPDATHRLYRGDPMLRREVLQPEVLEVLRPVYGNLKLDDPAKEQDRRLALARWIAQPQHPLTARVAVNRIWQGHFGTGLVDTPSDFGRNGSKPSHPELLDWLATWFVESGWSVKALHRLILTSATYQQASTPNAAALRIDNQARLLWRFPPRRLEAEVIRDMVLQSSGVLDLRMGGPGYLLFKPNDNYVRVYDAKEDWGPEDWRRMVYSHKVRMAQDGVFGAFDCPDAGLPAPKRSRSTTAIQALNLFNSTFVVQQAEFLARRSEREKPNDLGAQIRRAFQLVLQRPPSEGEFDVAMSVAREHGLVAVCRALFNTNEFLFLS